MYLSNLYLNTILLYLLNHGLHSFILFYISNINLYIIYIHYGLFFYAQLLMCIKIKIISNFIFYFKLRLFFISNYPIFYFKLHPIF